MLVGVAMQYITYVSVHFLLNFKKKIHMMFYGAFLLDMACTSSLEG